MRTCTVDGRPFQSDYVYTVQRYNLIADIEIHTRRGGCNYIRISTSKTLFFRCVEIAPYLDTVSDKNQNQLVFISYRLYLFSPSKYNKHLEMPKKI